MVRWILTYHHFIILWLLVLSSLMILLRGFYRDYKRKHKLQTYKWDLFVRAVTLFYLLGSVLIIGVVLGGRVIQLP